MISFIVPTLNEEKALEKTLTSLRQLSLPHEIIVTDGGSTDATVEKAKPLANKVVIHPKDKKQTISSNRNNGAQYATGEYLVFVDCDCIINTIDEFFTKALAHFNDQNVVALTPWTKTIPGLETWADRIILGFFNYTYVLMNNVLGMGAAVGKFQMIRRDSFLKLNGFREDLIAGEDHDMFRRLASIGKTRMEKNLIVYHTNRRAHQIGWPKLLWIWTVDTMAIMFKNKAASKEWTVVR